MIRFVRRILAALAMLSGAVACAGCHLSPKVAAATATIATVETIDAGIDTFKTWAIQEETNIARAAVDTCHGRADYDACAAAVVTPRRKPIDAAKEAIRAYRELLTAGADAASGSVLAAGERVITALAQVGIRLAVHS